MYSYRRACFIFIIVLLSGSVLLAGQVSLIADRLSRNNIAYFTTKDGVKFGVWGRGLSKNNLPVMFILSGTIEESLGDAYFRQCGDYFGRHKAWLCVSIDLPFHGKLSRPKGMAPLQAWANATLKGDDFVSANNSRMKSVLDELIITGKVDSTGMVVCGTSRGGYLALQYGTFDPRVRAIMAFAPVTDLLKLEEFVSVQPYRLLPIMELTGNLKTLAQKEIWMVIGDRDSRVSTTAALRFIDKLLVVKEETLDRGRLEFDIMYEPNGHTTPRGSVHRAIEWLQALFP